MQIAELFVALGVKGSEKTLTALSNTRLSISSIANVSLEATAAILGMAYALERITVGSANEATHIQNLAAYLGTTTTELQKWTYAAKVAGIQGAEMEQSLAGIYKTIQAFHTGKGLPAGTKVFAEESGLDITKPLDPYEVIRRAIKFTQSKRFSQDQINSVLESWGIGKGLIGAIESHKFNLADVTNAPILSTGEIGNLSRVRTELTKNEEKIRLFFGSFTSKHGNEIVKIIQNMTKAFLELATILDRIASKLHIFEIIDDVFKGWGTIFQFLDDFSSGKNDKNNVSGNSLIPSKQETIDLFKGIQKDIEATKALKNIPTPGQTIENSIMDSKRKLNPQLYAPPLSQKNLASPQNNNINVTQNLNFNGDGTDTNDIQNMHMDALERAIAETVSMLPRGRQT